MTFRAALEKHSEEKSVANTSIQYKTKKSHPIQDESNPLVELKESYAVLGSCEKQKTPYQK